MAFNSEQLNRAFATSEKIKNIIVTAYDTSLAHSIHVYIILAIVAALIGYGFILLFPFLAVTGLVKAFDGATTVVIDWAAVSIWLAVSLLSMFISYRCIQVRFTEPKGVKLTPEKAPELFNLIQQKRQHFRRPKIDAVVITDNYELNINKTPKWPLPVWSRNILVIGLPVMQCHSPESFSCLLTRRIGQFSKRNNTVTNWIYQLRSIWQQYLVAYRDQQLFGTEPLTWFFAVYTPFYKVASAVPSQHDDLKADSYAMELFNDEIVRETITTDSVYQTYLQQQYWPAISKVADIKKNVSLAPYKQLETTVRMYFTDKKINAAVKAEVAHEQSWRDETASLIRRLNNIGHDFPCMRLPQGRNATVTFLGESADPVTNLIDKLWISRRLELKKSGI
jgi:hypothetical protein